MPTDIKAGLPIRSEADGTDARVQVKLVDATNPGTQQCTVDADKNLHIEAHGNAPDGTTDKTLRLAENGAPNPDGIYDVTNNSAPATVGMTAQTRNATSSASRQAERPTAKRGTSDTDTVCLDAAIHDGSGNAYSATNPVPVQIVDETIGTPVHSYAVTGSTVSAGGTGTITYTNGANPLSMKRIVLSASGAIKANIAFGPALSEVTKYTVFNSVAQKNIILEIPDNLVVAPTDNVLITFTNEDEQAFSCYATIEGVET